MHPTYFDHFSGNGYPRQDISKINSATMCSHSFPKLSFTSRYPVLMLASFLFVQIQFNPVCCTVCWNSAEVITEEHLMFFNSLALGHAGDISGCLVEATLALSGLALVTRCLRINSSLVGRNLGVTKPLALKPQLQQEVHECGYGWS